MPTHVALLRGINLGPHKRVAMPALRALVEGLGHTDVATYIASGNVVFTAAAAESTLADDLEKAIEAELGVACRVVVLTSAELAGPSRTTRIPTSPTPSASTRSSSRGTPPAEARTHARAGAGKRRREGRSRDEAAIVGRMLYLHTPDGFGRSELAAELSKGAKRNPAEGTARNWATVTKLLAMCEG